MYPFSIMRLNSLNQDSELSMKHPMEVDTGSKWIIFTPFIKFVEKRKNVNELTLHLT